MYRISQYVISILRPPQDKSRFVKTRAFYKIFIGPVLYDFLFFVITLIELRPVEKTAQSESHSRIKSFIPSDITVDNVTFINSKFLVKFENFMTFIIIKLLGIQLSVF